MRRRFRQPRVSLLAFQDILSAVIGIIMLLVLLLATELRMVASVVQAESTPMQQLEIERERVSDLRDARAATRQEVDLLSRSIRDTSGRLPTDGLRTAAEIRAQLDVLREERNLVNREIEYEFRRLQDAELESSELRGKISARNQLQERVSRIKGELEQLEHSTRLVYRVQAGAGVSPLILVLGSSDIEIGLVDTNQPVSLRGQSPSARLEVCRSLLSQYDPSTHYVLLVARPSAGLELIQAIEESAKQMGFQLGLDLVPEGWSVFEGPTRGEEP